MTMRSTFTAAVLALITLAPAVYAVQPDEVLPDPVLEERARDISAGLRCLVCRNESIDDSNAELARDLRLLVRERLVEGDTDEEVVDYVVDRFGEYVLLKPTTGGANMLLWLAGPIMALLALFLAFGYLRGRSNAKTGAEDQLTAEEQERLNAILKD
jgi:cytochrome c-type biogenesis protein CcmH